MAAGKGVIVANDKDEACAAVDEILGDKKYGAAGSKIVVEEKLSGEEISVRNNLAEQIMRSFIFHFVFAVNAKLSLTFM